MPENTIPPSTVIFEKITELIAALKKNKPDDRSEMDRRWAIAITEAEKLSAYYYVYIYGEMPNDR